MINNVTLTGRLTKDMELKYTTSGAAVASATLAVERSFTDGNGERGSDFINFVIWRKSAENMANMTAKGSLIGIEGRLQTRSYENKQGQKVFITEVVVNNFSLLESKAVTDERKQGGQGNNFNQQQGGFNQSQQQPRQQQAQPQQQVGFNQQQPQGNFNQQPQQGAFSPEEMYGTPDNFENKLPF